MPQKCLLIYNPNAGSKRRAISNKPGPTLDILHELFRQYDITATFAPTKKPGDATQLAREAVAKGYDTVIAAGGDGTVGEVANGLVGSQTALAILPFGTFMNMAAMLSIPNDLDQAMMLIKIGKTATIDVGFVSKIDGENVAASYYFLESAGVGIDAVVQKLLWAWERKKYGSALHEFLELFRAYAKPVTIQAGSETITARASLISVANGPMMGAGIELSPESKLNDRQLTVSIFKMTRMDLLRYILFSLKKNPHQPQTVQKVQAKKVIISSVEDRPVHVDARWFGTLPAEFNIKPSALKVIAGFPKNKADAALNEHAYLEP